MFAVAPRSTRIHCGSLKRLAQRVVVLPSTARLGVKAAVSFEEEVAGLFSARLVLVPGVLVRVGVGPMGVLVRVAVGEVPTTAQVKVSQPPAVARSATRFALRFKSA